MPAFFEATYLDYGTPGEKSNVSFPGPTIDAINHDAQVALMTTLLAEMADITLGTLVNQRVISQSTDYAEDQPASAFAQRETKWLVRYRNSSTGEKRTLTLPCADLDKLDADVGNDVADMSDADVAAFVAAFEAYVTPPGWSQGDAEVVEILHVGRAT